MRAKGFTLWELLLVLAILGALATMVVPRVTGRAQKAKVTAAKTEVRVTLPAALDLYELDNGVFPTTEQGLEALVRRPTEEPLPPSWDGPYLRRPTIPRDPWGRPYVYRCPSTRPGLDYELFSLGPDGVEGTADDVGNWD